MSKEHVDCRGCGLKIRRSSVPNSVSGIIRCSCGGEIDVHETAHLRQGMCFLLWLGASFASAWAAGRFGLANFWVTLFVVAGALVALGIAAVVRSDRLARWIDGAD